MKHTNLVTITTLICAALPAQVEGARAAPPQGQDAFRASDQVALSDVLGAKVRLKAAATAGEVPADDERPTGSIDDLVLDSRSGRASWAIVSVGGMLGIGEKSVAVPAKALRCSNRGSAGVDQSNDADPVFELAATEAELKSLPAFDKGMFEKNGMEATLRNAETSWRQLHMDGTARAPADAAGERDSGRPADASGETGKAPAAALLASKLKGLAVRGSDAAAGDKDAKDFGEVSAAAIDPRSCTVSFLVVSRGGVLGVGESDYLVPFHATRLVLAGEDKQQVLTLPKSAAELESAPKYSKPDQGVVSDANVRVSCQYFGVQPGQGMRERGGVRPDTGKGGGR